MTFSYFYIPTKSDYKLFWLSMSSLSLPGFFSHSPADYCVVTFLKSGFQSSTVKQDFIGHKFHILPTNAILWHQPVLAKILAFGCWLFLFTTNIQLMTTKQATQRSINNKINKAVNKKTVLSGYEWSAKLWEKIRDHFLLSFSIFFGFTISVFVLLKWTFLMWGASCWVYDLWKYVSLETGIKTCSCLLHISILDSEQ